MARVLSAEERELLNRDLNKMNKSVIIDMLVNKQFPKEVTEPVKKYLGCLFRSSEGECVLKDAGAAETTGETVHCVREDHARCEERIVFFRRENELLVKINVNLERRIIDLETINSLLKDGNVYRKSDTQVKKGGSHDNSSRKHGADTVPISQARLRDGQFLANDIRHDCGGSASVAETSIDISPLNSVGSESGAVARPQPWRASFPASGAADDVQLHMRDAKFVRNNLNNNKASRHNLTDHQGVAGLRRVDEPVRRAEIAVGRKVQSAGVSLTSVPRDSYVHVYRLDPGTSVDEVKKYVRDVVGVGVVSCEKLTTRNQEHYSSFKVTVRRSDEDAALDPTRWPEGVHIKRFFLKRGPPNPEK